MSDNAMDKNSCESIKSRFTDYLNCRILGYEARTFSRHLQICKNCASALQKEIELQSMLFMQAGKSSVPEFEWGTALDTALKKLNVMETKPLINDKDWNRSLNNALDSLDACPVRVKPGPSGSFISLRAAAVLVFTLGIILILYKTLPHFNSNKIQISEKIIETQKKDVSENDTCFPEVFKETKAASFIKISKKSAVIMADKTKFHRYEKAGPKQEKFYIACGKALFKIEKNSYDNFEVQTPHLVCRVIGTVFQVNVFEGITTVSVLEGSVKVIDVMDKALDNIIKTGHEVVSGEKRIITPIKLNKEKELSIKKG